MVRINMAILDEDILFLNQFSKYLLDKSDKFTVSAFSDFEKFKKYSEFSKVDILLFSEKFIDDIDNNSKSIKILMSEGFNKNDEKYFCVNKYQKAEIFLKNVLMIYAENTGNSSAILSSDKNSYLIGFYSPVGGCGKTTLAISLAKTLTENNNKVLYLNLERISSLAGIFNDNSDKGFSDILLSAKRNDSNLQIKILTNTIQNMESKIYYINPPESAVEYSEMTDDEMMRILNELKGMNEFDYIIIDFVGEFNKRVFRILDICKKVIIPTTSNELAKQKIDLFIREMNLLGFDKTILNKATIIVNRIMVGEYNTFCKYGIKNMEIYENPKYYNIKDVLISNEYNEDMGNLITLIRD